jgi:hypothetical protein
VRSQDSALLALLRFGDHCITGGTLKHLVDALVGLGRTFNVFLRVDLASDLLGLSNEKS